MPRIDRKGLQAPARVLDDLELIPVNKIGPDILAVEQYETIWCLSRIRGIPQEISFGEVTDDAEMSLRAHSRLIWHRARQRNGNCRNCDSCAELRSDMPEVDHHLLRAEYDDGN